MAKKVDKNWEKEMERRASKQRAREKARGGGPENVISIRKSRFTFGKENLGKELKAVIVDFNYVNTFYKGKFKEEGGGNVPTCFAMSADGEKMKPHENVAKPVSRKCEACPKLEWGSGHGRGKACQERRRLALISADDLDSAESVADAEFAMIQLPVTSVANWGEYVEELDKKHKRPTYGVITKMKFDTNESYPKLEFEMEEKLDPEVVGALEERMEEAAEMLASPYAPASGRDKDEDDDEDEDDEDEDDEDEDDEDEDDEDEDDEDEDDEDEKPKKKGKGKKVKKGKKAKDEDDEDEDDEDEDDEDEDDEDEDDEDEDDEDEDDDDDEDEDDDEGEDDDEDEDEKPKRGKKKQAKKPAKKAPKKVTKKRGSRFSKK